MTVPTLSYLYLSKGAESVLLLLPWYFLCVFVYFYLSTERENLCHLSWYRPLVVFRTRPIGRSRRRCAGPWLVGASERRLGGGGVCQMCESESGEGTPEGGQGQMSHRRIGFSLNHWLAPLSPRLSPRLPRPPPSPHLLSHPPRWSRQPISRQRGGTLRVSMIGCCDTVFH